ncbi:hypothetical protein C8Q76DRAFT_801423 [Earliella scabrosa]|nr:hypothetical protein C8Q76DRAFT_801423 [Earliella scabrosa]
MDAQFPNVPLPPGARLLHVPSRAGPLPRFHVLKSHSKVKKGWLGKHGRILLYLQDTSLEAMDKFYKFVAQLRFPKGNKEAILAAGFVILHPGDHILCRNIHGSKQEEDDVLQMWVTANGIITADFRKQMKQARDNALGPREERSATKPTKVDGEYDGGAAFERDDSALNVRNAPRCYTLAQSYQVQRNIVGPAAGAKISMGDPPSDHLLLRKEILEAAAPLAIAALESSPPEFATAMRRQADVTNLPRVGFDGNYAFPTFQANFAATQEADEDALARMQADFGSFGGKHIDEHDCEGGITSMITYSDLDEDDDPGYFIVGDLGVAVLLEDLIIINFCGLRFHGGYPPTAAPGKKPKPWSYRFTVVCYPPRAMMNGSGIISFAVLPGNKVFQMPPEFIDPKMDERPVETNVANWVGSGMYLTSPASFLRFYHRGMCQIAHHFSRQIGDGAKIEIDYRKFAECFTMVDKHGTRHQAEFWELHPGSTATSTEFGCTRKEAAELWDVWNDDRSLYLPYSAHQKVVKLAAQQQEGSSKRKGKRKQTHDDDPQADETVPKPKKQKTQGAKKTAKRRASSQRPGHDVESPAVEAYAADDEQEGTGSLTSARTSAGERERLRFGAPAPRLSRWLRGEPPLTFRRPNSVYGLRLRTIDDESSGDDFYAPALYVSENNDPPQSKFDYAKDGTPESDQSNVPPGADGPTEVESDGDVLMMDSATPASGLPPFQAVLNLFALSHLKAERDRFRRIARAAFRSSAPPEQAVEAVDNFMAAFQSMGSDARTALAASTMWSAHSALRRSDDLAGLQLAVHRRAIMLSSAAAWYWLTQRCVSRCHRIVDQLRNKLEVQAPAEDWLHRLCSQVFSDVQKNNSGSYNIHEYLPDVLCASPITSLADLAHTSQDIGEVVSNNVVRLLRSWLNFPNNTQMLASYFIIYVIGSFKNADVLLLSGVWKAFQSVVTSVLGAKKKARRLDLRMLDELGVQLRALPLSQSGSEEAALLGDISSFIDKCAPGLQCWRDTFTHLPLSTSQPSAPPAPSPLASSSATLPLSGTSPLDDILAFALHVIPVARGDDLPSPSDLQQRTAKNADHFLPFRELAPSRQRVTGPGGPFHVEQRCQPGAFPSCLIFRALMFNSPIVHSGATCCYFRDVQSWHHFLADNRFDETDRQSIARFFNASCYGTRQEPRNQGKHIAPSYFDAEPRWRELVKTHAPQPIPFVEFFNWTQGRHPDGHFRNGNPRFKSIQGTGFTLVGKLTGYLLSADLVYAGFVAMPSVDEVAVVVHGNGLGSLKALQSAGLVEKKPSVQAVTDAFRQVYRCLEDGISAEDRAFIRFDPIMVEHLLCKYQRTRRFARY